MKIRLLSGMTNLCVLRKIISAYKLLVNIVDNQPVHLFKVIHKTSQPYNHIPSHILGTQRFTKAKNVLVKSSHVS